MPKFLLTFKQEIATLCNISVTLKSLHTKTEALEYVKTHPHCIGFNYYFCDDSPTDLANIRPIYDDEIFLKINPQTKLLKIQGTTVDLQEVANIPIVLFHDDSAYFQRINNTFNHIIDINKNSQIVESYLQFDLAGALTVRMRAVDEQFQYLKVNGLPHFTLYAFPSADFNIPLYHKIINLLQSLI